MFYVFGSSRVRRLVSSAAVAVGSLTGGIAYGQQYSYVNVNSVATGFNPVVTISRALAINSSGQLLGFYQTAAGASSRTFFTMAKGSSTIVPFASGLTYFSAGSSGGSAVGQIVNDNGNYLATSTASTPNPGGIYNSTTQAFSPLPIPSTYTGTFQYTGSNGTTYNQTDTASQFTPFSTNTSNNAAGILIYTASGGPGTVTTVNHGVIYNAQTGVTTDISGNPANITYNGTTSGRLDAVGTSSLAGISDNNIVVGSQGNASVALNGTPPDAIYGVPNGAGYTFSDLNSLITTLLPAGATYNSSTATAISKNGRYVIGNYIYTPSGSSTKYTHSFELTDDSSIADLGYISATNNFYTNVLDAIAVNDSGTVVGYGYTTGSIIHAFVSSGGVTSDLNAVAPSPNGAVYSEAYGLDNAGDIVGYTTPTNTTSTASVSAFALNVVVPEPASLSLLGFGAVALLGRRRARSTVGR